MPIHDYIISNGTGAAVRADINSALSAIVSLNSSASEPGTMYAYQLWADTAAGLLKIRNGTNSGWITLRQLDGDFSIVAVEDGLQATPSLTFTNDLNTGVFRSGADALAIVTGGQYAITCTSTQAVGIKTANPSTALHVAGNARVGADDVTDAVLEIGVGATGNRNSYIDIVGDTTYTDYGLRVIRNNTGANATSELKHRGTGALNFTTQEAAPIVFNTTNSPRLTILAGGNVGIGTSNPKMELQTGTSGGIQASSAAEIALRYNLYNSSGDKYIQAVYKAASMVMNSDGDFIFYNTNTASTAADSAVTGLTARMVIKASGNVGIGTTSPTSPLHVKSTGNGSSFTSSLELSDNSVNVNTLVIQQATGITRFLATWNGTGVDTNLTFWTTTSGGSQSERVRIDASGRLLVGTTTTSSTATIIAQGSNGGAAAPGVFRACHKTTPANDELFAYYLFGDSTHCDAAYIAAARDGGTWTSGTSHPTRLVFSTTPDGGSSPSPRMTIHSNGYITYGTGSIDAIGLTFGPTRSGANSAPTLTWNGSFSGTVTACDFLYNGTSQGSITTTTSATAYNTSSDYRLKENVTNVTDGIARLQQLNPSRFNFIADPDKTVDGFIAHEAQAVVPECVTGVKDEVDANGNPVYQGIDQSKLVPLLTAALQEAIAKIETLEARLTAAGIE